MARLMIPKTKLIADCLCVYLVASGSGLVEPDQLVLRQRELGITGGNGEIISPNSGA